MQKLFIKLFMRTSFSIYFSVLVILLFFTSCVNTNKTITATATYPPATVQGSVIDEENETPVSGATVWVEGTTIKTETDSEGKYTMKVPRGVYEVQVQRSGYEEKEESVEIENRSGRVSDFNFVLTPKPQRSLGAYNAGGGNSGNASALSEKHKDFISFYINNDLNCELKNPEDVRFADSDDDVLWINNPVELEVMNYEMGYKVIVDLEEFVSKEYS
ncbi:MAG TPA: carboxypeptidase-like regulatory domain-containing protein, partial [Gracilimonas sp.]|uniref:carboxypeptidase-like regulatory domain-containing protein n=1 Tax=Gracilimonas sp. TaxID=1974203 RepID=UPI002DA3F194|nr:carboxypeptidase-like regulatory domain-containing protein [Gracilimonas sp.]